MACKILHFTDTHLFRDPQTTLYGANPYRNLSALVADVLARALRPDLLLLTGDLVHDESESGYAALRDAVAPLGLVSYVLPGNHDDTSLLARFWPRQCATDGVLRVALERWQLLLLNSAAPGHIGGHLREADLCALDDYLNEADHFTLVALHHHPVAIGSPWMDTIGVDNGDRLVEILRRHPQCRAVLFGHVHQLFSAAIGTLRLYATPSTCVQFKPETETTEIDDKPPGYRILTLGDDGRIDTSVYWLGQ